LRLGAATRALLCIDRGVVRTADGLRERDISELEVEIVDGDPVDLFVFAAALAADLPLSIALAGKAARGVALVQGKPDGWDAPVRAEAIAHASGVSTADALAAILRECIRQVAANAPGLLADANPEWVHQMRIGTRRLRACLGLVAPLLPAPGVASLVAEVRWLAGTLGAIRDLDVFAEGILHALAQALSDDDVAAPALARLRVATLDAQRHCRDDARRAVASARFTRLVLAASALAAVPRFGVSAATGAADKLGEPAGHYAAGLMRKRHARLLRRMRSLVGGHGDEWHAVRIATKKTRYVAEFFADALASNKRARAFVDALAGVQDALGAINDAAAATRLARDLAGDDDALAVGAGAVHAWVAARRELLDATLAAAIRRYRKTDPFWHRN
jgi:CHAD domain-containing protein